MKLQQALSKANYKLDIKLLINLKKKFFFPFLLNAFCLFGGFLNEQAGEACLTCALTQGDSSEPKWHHSLTWQAAAPGSPVTKKRLQLWATDQPNHVALAGVSRLISSQMPLSSQKAPFSLLKCPPGYCPFPFNVFFFTICLHFSTWSPWANETTTTAQKEQWFCHSA